MDRRGPVGAAVVDREPPAGAHAFYEHKGWERWQGRTFVDTAEGRRPTPEDDDGVMILRTDRTGDLDANGDLVCDWRPGDVW